MREPGARSIARDAVVLAVILGATAYFGLHQVDRTFVPRYVAYDLGSPQAFVGGASAVGKSSIGRLRWDCSTPLEIPNAHFNRWDLLKIKLASRSGREDIKVSVGGTRVGRVEAGPSWRQYDVLLPHGGVGLGLQRLGSSGPGSPRAPAVHLSRLSYANYVGSSAPPIEAYLLFDPTPYAPPSPSLVGLLYAAVPLMAVLLCAGVRRLAALDLRFRGCLAAAVPGVLLLAVVELVDLFGPYRVVLTFPTVCFLFLVPAAMMAVFEARWRVVHVVQAGLGAVWRHLWSWRLKLAHLLARRATARLDQEDCLAGRPLGRAFTLFTIPAAVLTAIVGITVVQYFSGPLLGGGDLNQWYYQAYYVGHNLSFVPWPHLDLVNDQLFYPYGGSNVFMPWVFEMHLFVLGLRAIFGQGPWHQLYYLFTLAVTALGAFLILSREHGPRRAGLVALAVSFGDYYAVGKFPGHLSIACVHWTVLGILVDYVMVRRFVQGRRWSARLVLLRAFLLVAVLGLELGYVAGLSLSSFSLSMAYVLGIVLVRDRLRLDRLARRFRDGLRHFAVTAREHRWQVASLAAALGVVVFLYVPLVLEVFIEVHRFSGVAAKGGAGGVDPLRLIMPILPGFNPSTLGRFFPGRTETIFDAVPGIFFVLFAVLGLTLGRRRIATLVPSLVLFALLISYSPRGFSPLSLFPWFSYARIAARFTVAYPVLLSLFGLALPAWATRGRWGRLLAICGVSLLAVEMWTAYGISITRPKGLTGPSPQYLAFMAKVKAAPGEAVLDWPFCMAGGNGVGTGLLGRYYSLQSGIYIHQAFHGKKIVAKYFGRLDPEQIKPYVTAGWPRLFFPDNASPHRARRQRRDFSPHEWDFFQHFFQYNDFCGIILYTDLLPRETVEGFHRRFGEPVAVASGHPYGRMEFIPKKPAWRLLVDRRAGLEPFVPLAIQWPVGRRVDFRDPAVTDYQGAGWHGASTEGHRAELRFGLTKVEPLVFVMRANAYETQRVEARLNGVPIVSSTLGRRAEVVVWRLPAADLRLDNRLLIELPDAHSPFSRGVSGDRRLLGLTVEWARLDRQAAPELPVPVRVRMDAAGTDEFLADGWGSAEPGRRSTRGRTAVIRFSLDHVRPLTMILVGRTFQRQRVVVELNGTKVSQFVDDGKGRKRYRIPLPTPALCQDNSLVFQLPDAHSPKSAGINEDTRVLGLTVWSVRFLEAEGQ